MKLGIIGLAGSGKTTVFEALTRDFAGSGNKADTRLGTIKVPDDRVDALSRIFVPQKTIFAQVSYFLPGKGAQKKDGGRDESAWTAARDADALIHVVRNFRPFGLEDPNPADDFTRLDQELIISDLVVVEKKLERMAADSKKALKSDPEERLLLEECKASLDAEIPLRRVPQLAEARVLRGYAFLSAKPMLVLFNNTDDDQTAPDDPVFAHDPHMVIRGKIEHELAQMSEEDAVELLVEFDISAPATDRVIQKSYDLLGLISFFTVGEDEVRAWTIQKGTVALDAAEVIHSDLKKGFIRAEVTGYDDFMAAGSLAEARKRGTLRLEGKTYVVADGDIITIRFNI